MTAIEQGVSPSATAALERASASLERTSANLERTSALMKELRQSQRETDRRMHETDRQMEETDRRMQETARRQQETDRQMQETDRRLRKAENLFTTQWGRLVESLVEGDLVPLLHARGIEVEGTSSRSRKRRNGEHFEIDILVTNGSEVVAVEVKTTLRPEDVGRFVEKLARFHDWYPEYRRHAVYGAVAFLRTDPTVITAAEGRGLFVIRATGRSARIVNGPGFKPRVFS